MTSNSHAAFIAWSNFYSFVILKESLQKNVSSISVAIPKFDRQYLSASEGSYESWIELAFLSGSTENLRQPICWRPFQLAPSSPTIDLKFLYSVVCLLPSAKWNQTVYVGESHNTSIAGDGMLWPITLTETDWLTRDKWTISADNWRLFIGGYHWLKVRVAAVHVYARSHRVYWESYCREHPFINPFHFPTGWCIYLLQLEIRVCRTVSGVAGVLPGAKGIFLQLCPPLLIDHF